MNKSERRTIKVVRKNTAVSPPATAWCASNHSISAAVDGWILERDQNRKGEVVSSNTSIQKWKALPESNAADGMNVPENGQPSNDDPFKVKSYVRSKNVSQ